MEKSFLVVIKKRGEKKKTSCRSLSDTGWIPSSIDGSCPAGRPVESLLLLLFPRGQIASRERKKRGQNKMADNILLPLLPPPLCVLFKLNLFSLFPWAHAIRPLRSHFVFLGCPGSLPCLRPSLLVTSSSNPSYLDTLETVSKGASSFRSL